MTDDDMAQIPGGTFRMGSDTHYLDERPAHSVTVDAFRMNRHTVTTPTSRLLSRPPAT